MFNQLTEWEIPETTPTTTIGTHDITALTRNADLIGYTKHYADHAGILDPAGNLLQEYSLRRANGRPLYLGDLVPFRNRFNQQKAGRFFLNSRHGIIYFDPGNRFALLTEIEGHSRLEEFPAQLDFDNYEASELFVRFAGEGLFYDSAGRLYRGGVSCRDHLFNQNSTVITRWERSIPQSRFVTVWRGDAKYKGAPYRYWEDKNHRIWLTMHRPNGSNTGGHSFVVLDPATNDLQGWEFGYTGAGSLGGPRDMGGIVGDNDREMIWFAWPSKMRIFKFADIFSPFVFSPDIEAFFHPDGPHPHAEFGTPHDLAPITPKEFLFTNDNKSYVGLMHTNGPPDELRSASSYPLNQPALLYRVRFERLRVQKVYDQRISTSVSAAQQQDVMNPPFLRWPTPGTGHHPNYQDQELYFIKPRRTISLLR